MPTLRWRIQSDAIRQVHARLIDHPAGTGWPDHDHDYVECFCVDAGSLRHEWCGETTDLLPGDLVALLPGEAHAAVSGAAGARIINISCAPAGLTWLRQRAGDRPTPWDGDRRQRLRAVGRQQRDLLRAMVALVDGAHRTGRDLALLALQQVCRPGGADPLPLWLERVLRDHIDAGDSGGVQALAQRCGQSREHLSRQVRRHTGRSAQQLLQDHRLDRAALLLRASDTALPAIAEEVGFRSLSAFYAAFGRRFGCAPAAWRRRYHLG